MLSGLNPLHDTAAHMAFQQQLTDSAERSLNSCQLVKHVIAVRIALNHAFNPADLSFYPVKPGSQSVLKFLGMVALAHTRSMTAAVAGCRSLLLFLWCHLTYLPVSWLQTKLNIPPMGMSRKLFMQ
ncbi:hypothetical protein D3C75_284000 [compost metagenome]